MANQVKITKKMKLNAIANLLKELANNEELEISLENGVTLDMAVEYCENEVALLEKKNATKSESKKDKEKKEHDKVLQVAILEAMENGVDYNCTTIRNICPEVSDYAVISASKLSYLLTDMIKQNLIVRKEIKRIPHYAKVVETGVEG